MWERESRDSSDLFQTLLFLLLVVQHSHQLFERLWFWRENSPNIGRQSSSFSSCSSPRFSLNTFFFSSSLESSIVQVWKCQRYKAKNIIYFWVLIGFETQWGKLSETFSIIILQVGFKNTQWPNRGVFSLCLAGQFVKLWREKVGFENKKNKTKKQSI